MWMRMKCHGLIQTPEFRSHALLLSTVDHDAVRFSRATFLACNYFASVQGCLLVLLVAVVIAVIWG